MNKSCTVRSGVEFRLRNSVERWVSGVVLLSSLSGAALGQVPLQLDDDCTVTIGNQTAVVVVSKVLHEIFDRNGQLGEQLCVPRNFLRMVIVTKMVGVEDSCAKPRRVDPGHVF